MWRIIELIPVSSSNLAAVGYDPMNKVLKIRFNKGGLYRYDNVPENILQI